MTTVIGDLLPVALGVTISPVPIIAVILMLLGPRARGTSLGFLVGWVVGVTIVVALTALLVAPVDEDASSPSTLVSVVKMVLGAVAVLLAFQQWTHRPAAGEAAELPGWMSAVDTMTPVRAAVTAAVLAGVNPKNLTLCLAGGATIGGADLDAAGTAWAVTVFVLVASASVAIPVVGFFVMSDRVAAPLSRLRTWLTANNAVVMAVLLLVVGVTVFGKGLAGL